MPQLNSKDILAQKEIEAELKKKVKQSNLASMKWGTSDHMPQAVHLAGFE